MSYDKNTWAKGDVITANKLNNMEDGIANAGGGGVLVVTVDADDALDKTWQEIHDAGFAIKASDVSPEVGWLTQLYSNGTGYYVAFSEVINGNVITVVYVAETADDYPAEE
jgi:hypothetical protein